MPTEDLTTLTQQNYIIDKEQNPPFKFMKGLPAQIFSGLSFVLNRL